MREAELNPSWRQFCQRPVGFRRDSEARVPEARIPGSYGWYEAAKPYRVHRLEDGSPEWKAAGLPVEAAAWDKRILVLHGQEH